MNGPIRRVGILVLVLTVVPLANLTYVQVITASDYRGDPRNPGG